MTTSTPTRPRIKPSEEGYMLIAVMFMLAILLVAMSVAVPKIAKQIQRDREIETMRRGKAYVRGIKMYYKKFGSYPPNMDALVMSNQIRFLRKKYIDPTTGKDEWKLIHVGQNKTQTLGFFGQPLAGSMPGAPGNPLGTPGAPGTGGPGATTGTSSVFGSSSNGSPSSSPTDPGTNPTNPAGATPGSTDPTTGTPTDPNAPGGTGTGTGLTGQTFGGGIMGVSPGSPKQSILVYKKKTHYNEWEFFYDPRVEQMMQGGNLGTGINPSSPAGGTGSTTGGGTGATTGGGAGGTTGGSTGGTTGGAGSTPPPQQ